MPPPSVTTSGTTPPTHTPSPGIWRRVFSATPGVPGAIGVLLYGALTIVGFRAQGKLLHRWLPGMDASVLYVTGHVTELTEILVFAWVASRLERRSFAAYGLPWRQALKARFWNGAALGIGSLIVLVLLLATVGGLRLSLPPHVGTGALLAGAGYLLLFIVLGLREEFLYRGYGLSALAGNIGFWPAAVISSAWFVTTHTGNSGETALGLSAVGFFGLFACVLLRRTGSLWMPIGFHAAWDWGETFLFGVSDSGHAAASGHFFTASVTKSVPAWLSGGSAGPEGSVLCLVMFATLTVGFALRRYKSLDGRRGGGPTWPQ